MKKYVSREPEGNVVPVDATDGATVAIAGVIHHDVDPELGEVPDLEGVHDVKLGERWEVRDGSGETVDITVRVAHRHGEKEGWFYQGVR